MSEDDASPEGAGMRVESRIMLFIGAAVALGAAVYAGLAYEDSGTTLLALTAGMALLMGGYLALQARKRPDPSGGHRPSGTTAEVVDQEYLPHASIWPFGVGMGAIVAFNGLALGTWALLPGLVLTGASLMGYARQSRRRD